MTELYEIIKKHLELKDNWYNNPYMPKEKVEALFQELGALMSDTYKRGKSDGQQEMICGISLFINEALDAKKREIGLFGLKEGFVTSHIRWQRKDLEDAERRAKESSEGSGQKAGG